jgi:hypothetical protein
MERTIKIELIEADVWSFVKDKTVPPDGIKIEGPIGTQLCGPDSHPMATYLLITITSLGGLAVEVAKEVVVKAAADWIAKYLTNHKTKRARINGRNADSKTMARIIRKEIKPRRKHRQVGKGED